MPADDGAVGHEYNVAMDSRERLVRQSIDLRPAQKLIQRILDRYQPEQIWLFGSRARGTAQPLSDWDLFVVVPDSISDSELSLKDAWQLQLDSGVYADVIPCRAADFLEDRDVVNTLCHEVAREGVLIYER